MKDKLQAVVKQLKEAGYKAVRAVPASGKSPRIDLHCEPAILNPKKPEFSALPVIEGAGLKFREGGVRVFNGILIVPDINDRTEKPAAEKSSSAKSVVAGVSPAGSAPQPNDMLTVSGGREVDDGQ